MSRLPTPGSDNGQWGEILNEFLRVEHNNDGSLKTTPVPISSKGQPSGVAELDGGGKVPNSQLPASVFAGDASTTQKGVLKLAGDLGGTADLPTVPGLAGKADSSTVLIKTNNFSDLNNFTTARQNLGVAIGSDVQAWDAELDTWSTKTAPAGTVVGTSDSQILTNKTLTGPIINTPTGITKSDVGLASVDNTSDANKPVSTANQTALDLKENTANKSTNISLGTSDTLFPTQNAVKSYVDTASGSYVPLSGGTMTGDLLFAKSGSVAIGTSNTQSLKIHVNNSEVARFDQYGQLGIGTGAPARPLHIRGENATFRIDRNANTVGFQMHRFATDWGSVEKGFIIGVQSGGSNNGYFSIQDYGVNTSGGATERFRIANDGAFRLGSTTQNGFVNIGTDTTSAAGGLYFGSDTNLYRSASNTLRTDGSLVVTGNFAALNISGTNTGDQDLSALVQKAGDTMTGALTIGTNNGSTSPSLYLGDAANSNVFESYNGRAFVGYDASGYARIQGGTSKGIRFSVNNPTFGSGTVLDIDTSGNITSIGDTTLKLSGTTNKLIIGGTAYGSYGLYLRDDAVNGVSMGFNNLVNIGGTTGGLVYATGNFKGIGWAAGHATNDALTVTTGDLDVVIHGTSGYLLLGTSTSTSRLSLASGTTAAQGIAFGTDVNLYRSAGNTLRTDDAFYAGGAIVSSASVTAINRMYITNSGSNFPGLEAYASTDSGFVYHYFYRSRASATQTITNDVLGAFGFRGHTGSAYMTQDSVRLSGVAAESTGGTSYGGHLDVNQVTTGTASSVLTWRFASGGVLQSRVTGASGGLSFGSGTTQDVNLYRSAANVLMTDDAFTAAGIITAQAGINANSQIVSNVATPSAAADAVNKQYVDSAVNSIQSINPQNDTTYILVIGDTGKLITLSNAAPITLTVPPDASVAFAVGSRIDLAQTGTGQVTVAAGVGVTVSATPGLKLSSQYAGATLVKTDTDAWLLFGSLAA